jgi:undecaprenyl-phosphate galactose phosphotransferase
MTLLGRNILVSIALALSDFISFIVSMYLAIGLLYLCLNDYESIIPSNQTEGWIALHWLLAFCCVGGTQLDYGIIFIENILV